MKSEIENKVKQASGCDIELFSDNGMIYYSPQAVFYYKFEHETRQIIPPLCFNCDNWIDLVVEVILDDIQQTELF